MNALESYNGTIMGEESECAQFTIDTLTSPFVLSDITKAGEQYTFGFWIRADTDGSISTCGKTITATSEWVRHVVTFTATGPDVKIFFATAGVYYIFHPQLELGSMDTDYDRAPEDIEDLIANTANTIENETQVIRENVANLTVEAVGIRTELSDTQKVVDGISGDLLQANSKITSLEQTSEQVQINVQNINENGVDKVTTTTGFTFNESGMEVDKSDSPTKTTVTPDGMKVYRKAGGDSEVLTATSEGVDATNLHAKTYLIIGGRTRFEKYGNDRVGCYWIGGN